MAYNGFVDRRRLSPGQQNTLTQTIMASAYHRTQQLRLKHLEIGELFRFNHDVLTQPWTKFNGEPGEQTIVFSADQTYKKISARKIQAVDSWIVAATQQVKEKVTGKPCGLGKGDGDRAVHQSWFVS